MNNPTIIYQFSNSQESSTHYEVELYNKQTNRWDRINPYDKYQLRNSQGYCQLFAFMLAKYDTKELKDLGFRETKQPDNIHVISNREFYNLAHNTLLVFQHFYHTFHRYLFLSDQRYKMQLLDDYKQIDKSYYGIKSRTRIDKIMKELSQLTLRDVMDYLKDNIWDDPTKYKTQINRINKFVESCGPPTDMSSYSVSPTDNETPYEAYQSIIATIFATNLGGSSVYDQLLSIYNINIRSYI